MLNKSGSAGRDMSAAGDDASRLHPGHPGWIEAPRPCSDDLRVCHTAGPAMICRSGATRGVGTSIMGGAVGP